LQRSLVAIDVVSWGRWKTIDVWDMRIGIWDIGVEWGVRKVCNSGLVGRGLSRARGRDGCCECCRWSAHYRLVRAVFLRLVPVRSAFLEERGASSDSPCITEAGV